MNSSSQNTDRSKSRTALSFNVVPLESLRLSHLKTLIGHYARGLSQPLILGTPESPEQPNQPRAVLIPFQDYLRLMDYDRRNQENIQKELSERAKRLDDPQTQTLSLEQLIDELGPEITGGSASNAPGRS